MREIKFRYRFEDGAGGIHILTTTVEELEYHLDIPANIGLGWALVARDEYTGLHDKNGVEVYEGDIVQLDSRDIGGWKISGEVVFNLDQTLSNMEWGIWTDRGYCTTDFLGCLEVIGNIYENPELLVQSTTDDGKVEDE